ncbi:MAG: hypothetical protein HFE39_01560 [Clostridiales bacterium]|jgi:hypothetical protein|nr:hypothetical protein [Clostridiales bacterium]
MTNNRRENNSPYVRAVDRIQATDRFRQAAACNMRRALDQLPAKPKRPFILNRRVWIPMTASLALLICLCVVGLYVIPGSSYMRDDQPLWEHTEPEIAQEPSFVWEGRRYQMHNEPMDGLQISSAMPQASLGTVTITGTPCPIYPAEGLPSQLFLIANPNGDQSVLFSFVGFCSQEHSMSDLLALYREACGDVISISCVRKDYSKPDLREEPLVETSSPDEIERLLTAFSSMRPDATIRVNQGSTHYSSDGSTVMHTIETDGRALEVRFENGLFLRVFLYLDDGAAGGYGYLYPLPQIISDWVLKRS